MAATKNKDQVKALLAKHGAKQLSDLPISTEGAAILAAVTALDNKEAA